MTTYLKYQRPGVQFAVFFGLAITMFLINIFLTRLLFPELGTILASPDTQISREALIQFRWAQLAGTVIAFIVPALLFSYLADERPINYIGFKSNTKPFILLIVILLVFTAQPFALYLGHLNEQVNFGALHNEMRKAEELYEKTLSNFIKMDTPLDLTANLLLIGLLPALAEELFFRGGLQNILERWTRSPWAAILMSSIAFALLHGTFFKFLGIFTLGAVLGILFYLTRNLWYNIFFHFLNNALALLTTYYASSNEMLRRLADDKIQVNIWIALISLAVTIGLFFLIRKRVPYQPLPEPGPKEEFDI